MDTQDEDQSFSRMSGQPGPEGKLVSGRIDLSSRISAQPGIEHNVGEVTRQMQAAVELGVPVIVPNPPVMLGLEVEQDAQHAQR